VQQRKIKTQHGDKVAMPISEGSEEDGQLFTHVDDEQFDELSELNGQPVVHVSVWEEGLADAITAAGREGAESSDEVAADIDLYLRDGVYFELYGTLCYTDLDASPLADLIQIEEKLQQLIKGGVVLEEVAVDEDEGLVLVLAQRHKPVLYLQVGAWLLDEWEELPDISAP
jgi:hypothetical protein